MVSLLPVREVPVRPHPKRGGRGKEVNEMKNLRDSVVAIAGFIILFEDYLNDYTKFNPEKASEAIELLGWIGLHTLEIFEKVLQESPPEHPLLNNVLQGSKRDLEKFVLKSSKVSQ